MIADRFALNSPGSVSKRVCRVQVVNGYLEANDLLVTGKLRHMTFRQREGKEGFFLERRSDLIIK